MIKSILLLSIGDGSDWRFWGNLIKILIIFLCIAIIAVISWRKANNTFCKNCKRRVKKSHKNCNHCGTQMTPDNKEVIIGISKNTKVVSILAICILSIVTIFSVFQLFNNYEFSSYGTGIYTGYEQTYTKDENIWGVECKKALSDGTFHQTINTDNKSVKTLYIESESTSGTLILNIKQGDKTKSIDISNINGVLEYDLSDFYDDSKLELNVEHSKVENVHFKIYW